MSPPEDVWSEIAAIILKAHAETESSGAKRVSVKTRIYQDLKAKGHDKAAEMFMTYDAVVRASMADQPTNVFNFNNAQIANANFGQQLGTINASLQAVSTRDADGANFADALKRLTEAVVNTPELKDDQKKELLEGLSFLGKQAEEPPEKRHAGILKPVLKSIPDMLSSGASLVALWQALGPHILKFFGM